MRTINKILFALLCTVTFAIVFIISMGLRFGKAIEESKATISVDWNDDTGSVYKDLRYNNTEDCGYDLYLPAQRSKSSRYSLILFIHGGSFTGGDKSEGDVWCKYYASRGYVAATVNYTLHNDKHPSSINIMHNDIKTCVDSIKAKCMALGYHIDEMATTGVSAGGCLAMLYAYREADSSSVPLKFVFQQTGPTSFHCEHWGFEEKDEKVTFASMLLGQSITDSMIANETFRLMIDSISPACHITPRSVPTICAYGPNDRIVPTNQKFILMDSLKRHGVPHIYIEFPNSGHALANDPDSMAAYVARADEFCDKYFKNKTDAPL